MSNVGVLSSGKKGSVREIVKGLYEIASELLISTDKNAQEQGRQLRRLIEKLEKSINTPGVNG